MPESDVPEPTNWTARLGGGPRGTSRHCQLAHRVPEPEITDAAGNLCLLQSRKHPFSHLFPAWLIITNHHSQWYRKLKIHKEEDVEETTQKPKPEPLCRLWRGRLHTLISAGWDEQSCWHSNVNYAAEAWSFWVKRKGPHGAFYVNPN